MISYQTTRQLRLLRSEAPSAPYWQALAVAPYSAVRAKPLAIDYLTLTATAPARVEAIVCNDPADQLDRTRRVDPPLFIEAAEASEVVFRRGEAVLEWAIRNSLPATQLISTEGAVPRVSGDRSTLLAISAWPPVSAKLEELLVEATGRGLQCGIVLPIVYPITTELSLIASLVEVASRNGATFFAAVATDLFPAAKHAIAESIQDDPETYDTLFHSDLETINVATERHVAAIAHEHGMKDHLPLPLPGRSNWTAATELARAGARLIRMQKNSELGWDLVRSSRVVATLNKPIERVAESASLSIIETLDEFSISALTDWLATGRSAEIDAIDEEWRLRRDYVVESE